MTQQESVGTGLEKRLRQARLERGLTLEEVAAEAGLDVSTIWRYEHGRVKPSKVALKMLSLIYEKPFGWFWAVEDGTDGAPEMSGEGAPDDVGRRYPVERTKRVVCFELAHAEGLANLSDGDLREVVLLILKLGWKLAEGK